MCLSSPQRNAQCPLFALHLSMPLSLFHHMHVKASYRSEIYRVQIRDLQSTDQRFPENFGFPFSSPPKPQLPTRRRPLSPRNVIALRFFCSPANCRQAKEAEEEEERRRQRVNQVRFNHPTVQNRINVYIFRPFGSTKPQKKGGTG